MQPTTLILIVDGWPRETLRHELSVGNLPTLAGLAQSGVHLRDLATPIPSVSVASHATILTGVMPRWHRLPAHRWRDENGYRNYIGMDILRANRDMAEDVRTVFESHPGRSIAIQSIINRGADRTVRFPTLSSRVLLAAAKRTLLSHPGSLVACWLPKGDSVGHRLGPACPEFSEEMRVVDSALGEVVDAVRSECGADRPLRVALVADHGQKAISEHVNPATLLTSEILTDRTIRVNSRRSRPEDILVATSGDSAASVYLPKGIGRNDRLSIAERFAVHPSVDAVALAELDGGAEHHTFIRDGEMCSVELSGCADLERESTHQPPWVRSYLQSFVPGRSGDILILANEESDFVARRRIGWGMGHHRGSHGGAHDSEMYVDGIMSGVADTVRADDVASFMQLLTPLPRGAEWTLT